jgi:predicted HAD superfamily Cof-like phosphohydrolase
MTKLNKKGGFMSNFKDVEDFIVKYEVPYFKNPGFLDLETLKFRINFMEEELNEFKDSCSNSNLEGMADALIDLVYVAMGTAKMMGLPWEALWEEVHSCNMKKIKVSNILDSKRKSPIDVVKPKDWKQPDIKKILKESI